ncbi:RNA polymerase sigma factor [candidate division WOR-3 bacterium]|nr:RNA polymerase sigma factor [candidate division WOR-3 bacterium]
MMNKEEEREIVRRIISGEKEALAFFIHSYKKLVFHVAGKLIDDRDDLEDACQDIFIKIHGSLCSFDHGCKLSTWIAKISYNHACNFLKKRKKTLNFSSLPQNFSEDYDGCIVTCSDVKNGKNSTNKNLGENQLLDLCLEKLEPVQREITYLYHVEDFTYEEISSSLSMPLGTVKSHLFRARKNLKNMLSKYKERENEAS